MVSIPLIRRCGFRSIMLTAPYVNLLFWWYIGRRRSPAPRKTRLPWGSQISQCASLRRVPRPRPYPQLFNREFVKPPSTLCPFLISTRCRLSVPSRVQVVRRRPFRADPEDALPIPQSTEQVTTSAPGERTPETFYEFLAPLGVVYILLFLGLPDRYSQEAPKDVDGTGRNSCQRWINEWTYVGTGALAICG
jgi:hypothetical protein